MTRYASPADPVSLRAASALGALVSAGLTVFVFRRFPPFTMLTGGLTLGFTLYALLGARDESALGQGRTDAYMITDPRMPGVLTVAFLVLNATAVGSISTAYYTKPLLYYVCVGLAAGVLAVRIILTDAHLTNATLALVYGLNTFVSNQLAFPLGLNGPDIGVHTSLAAGIVELGHIPDIGTQYVGFPAQHMVAATATVLTGGAVVPTYRAFGIGGMLLGLPITYLIARKLQSRRFATLAVVLYASMEYVVYRAGHPSKMAYALPLLLLMFATVVYLYENRTPGMLLLFGLFAVALIFTHAHTAMVTLFLLGSLAVGQAVLSRGLPLLDGAGDRGRARGDVNLVDGRGHMLALLFIIAFIAQFLYFSQFFATLVDVATQYVDVLVLSGGSDATKETPRFGTIPTNVLLVNTIGSGLLTLLITIGALDQIRRRVSFSILLIGWLAVAGVLMVGGVVLDVQFALPNRIYVVAEFTGFGLLAAAGITYLLRQAQWRPNPRITVLLIVGLFVGLAFFSTASTIAGIETSPFNEDVPHRTWYGMTEENAAEAFLADGGATAEHAAEFRWARSFPVTDAGAINYSTTNTTVVGLNDHKMQSGVVAGGGSGRIGTNVYVVPNDSRSGLGDSTQVYDNGVIDVFELEGEANST